MRSCFVLLFVSLLTSCEAQGTFGTPVFVLKGRDLLLKLHADPPEGVLYVNWKINGTVTLVRLDSRGGGTVTGRFEFPGRFYVIMKNLQEADSGVYSAVAVTSTGDKPVAEYKVTVQGPVSPVELIVDRVDSSSSESCDLHVTCRTHNSHISSTFKCPKGVCRQEGGERSEVTTSGASLQVYLLNSIIICNHSNQVHGTQDLIHAELLCSSKPDPPLHPVMVTVICILTVLTLIMIVVLIVWRYNRRRLIRSTKMLESVLGSQVETPMLQNENPTPTQPPDGTPADPDPGSTKSQEAADQGKGRERSKSHLVVNTTHGIPGLGKIQEDAKQGLKRFPQIAASAQHQDGLGKIQEAADQQAKSRIIHKKSVSDPLPARNPAAFFSGLGKIQEAADQEVTSAPRRIPNIFTSGSTLKQMETMKKAAQVIQDLQEKKAGTAPPQDDAFFKDIGKAVLQEIKDLREKKAGTAPHQNGTPADSDPDAFFKDFGEAVLQGLTAAHQNNDPTTAPSKTWNAADIHSDAFFKDFGEAVLQGLERFPLIAASAPPQDGTPADPDPGSSPRDKETPEGAALEKKRTAEALMLQDELKRLEQKEQLSPQEGAYLYVLRAKAAKAAKAAEAAPLASQSLGQLLNADASGLSSSSVEPDAGSTQP